MQAFKTKLGQRVFSAFGNSPMGYSFPAAIGASIAKKINKKSYLYRWRWQFSNKYARTTNCCK